MRSRLGSPSSLVGLKKPASTKAWLSQFRNKTSPRSEIRFFIAQLCIPSLARILSVQQGPLALTFDAFPKQLSILGSLHPDKNVLWDVNLHFLLDLMQEMRQQSQTSLNKVCLIILTSQNIFSFITPRNT